MCNNLKCKFCKSSRVNKRGKQQYNNKQRYLCRDCGKIFTEGKDLRLKYSNNKKMKVIKEYLENVGIRSIGRIENIHNTTVLSRIKNMGKQIKERIDEIRNSIPDNLEKKNIQILEIDEN